MIINCNTSYLPYKLSEIFPHMSTIIVWFSGLEMIIPYAIQSKVINEINFQDNLIQYLYEDTFSQTPNVRKLNLGSNKIQNLPEKMFSKLEHLETFIADRNEIEFLHAALFEMNPSIIFINLNNNKIKEIGIDFTKMKSLQKVLGMQNACGDFYLTKKFDAKMLNKLVHEKCRAIGAEEIPQ